MSYSLIPIGEFEALDGATLIRIRPPYREAMRGLEEFSHLLVLWWFDECDDEKSRANLVETKPYKKGPDALGVFATRSPERPNPIAVSVVDVLSVDAEQGIIWIPYADAFPGTPVLDIKPYMPSLDRIEHVEMPAWCAHWPSCVETSGDFDWEAEFNF